MRAVTAVPLCFLIASCGGPTTPSATGQTGAILNASYEHVVTFDLDSTMRIELELWDCRNAGLLPGLQGPIVCLLEKEPNGQFSCLDRTFMDFVSHVSTGCDNGIDVLVRTATRNPLLQTGHNIYLNGTLVTRTKSAAPLDYPREIASFRITPAGQIY